jgi:hypothetical protein
METVAVTCFYFTPPSPENLPVTALPCVSALAVSNRTVGVDGTQSFETWLTLSSDHLLPRGHPNRDNPDYIVTACNFCNTAENRYFEKAVKMGLSFDNLTPDALIAQRLPFVETTRQSYRAFWETNVKQSEE